MDQRVWIVVSMTCLSLASSAEQSRIELSQEKLLVKKLLKDYQEVGQIGRPIKDISQPIVVDFGLGLIMMDVIEKHNTLTMSVWTKLIAESWISEGAEIYVATPFSFVARLYAERQRLMATYCNKKWRDEYLTWDPRTYGGVSSVKLPTSLIWMPDIMLLNTASTERFEREVPAVVSYDGNITWFPHRIFHSTCAIDVQRYPFDNQTCHIWFGSWTHSVAELNLRLAIPEGIDLSTFKADFKETSKWDIERVDAAPLGAQQGGDDVPVLTFTLYLRRRIIFSSYILTVPVVFMSFLTLLVFYLPVDNADKSTLGLTIFGSLLLLLLILVEAAPPTASAVPMLGLYYCLNIVLVVLAIIVSSIICKIGDAKSCRRRNFVPKCLRLIFFRIFAKLLCMDQPHIEAHGRANENGNVCLVTQESEVSQKLMVCLEKLSSVAAVVSQHSDEETERCHQVRRACTNLKEFQQEEGGQEIQRAAILSEWQFLAAVLDRIFLVLYLVIIIGSLAFLFPR